MNQGTPEWHAARAGHVTASRFADVLAKPKSGVGEASTRAKYRWELVAERLTGGAVEGYTNDAMRRGQELEPHARLAYEADSGHIVEEFGFIVHPAIALVGCSPDGLIGADGGCEIKCPANPVIHAQTLHGGMPTEHRPQVQGSLWVTGRQWWAFISYDPRMPKRLQLYVEIVKRDEAYIEKLAEEVVRFQSEVERQVVSLLTLAEAA
jgi:putative phage-type endonuclease